MNKFLIGWLALTVVALLGDTLHAQPRGRGGDLGQAARYGWMSDYREAKAVARKTGKPLMVVLRCEP